MNCKRFGMIVCALIGLTACASQTTEDNYYSLVLAVEEITSPVDVASATTRLIVGPIQLARYLKQTGLPLQIGKSEIRVANHHFWAEPLDEAIAKVLVWDISNKANNVAVDRASGRWTVGGDCQLRVEFDRFHATDESRVVAAGRYWIHETNPEQVTRKEFEIVQVLSADGYPQVVHQLRMSLQTLAEEIVIQLSASDTCA